MKKIISFFLLFLLTNCGSYTYVSYDKDGKGDVKTKRGIQPSGTPLIRPYFRFNDKPFKQKKGRIKRAKKRKTKA
jgi:hypothetical protein